jgi:hypothetical protein
MPKCETCEDTRLVYCPGCYGNGCAACHHDGVIECPDCTEEGTRAQTAPRRGHNDNARDRRSRGAA